MATSRIDIRDRGPGMLDIVIDGNFRGQIIRTSEGWQQTSPTGRFIDKPYEDKVKAVLAIREKLQHG